MLKFNNIIKLCVLCCGVLFSEEKSNLYIDSTISIVSNSSFKENSKTTFHLFSHGKAGALFLGNEWKNPVQIAQFLKDKIDPNIKHINIYGCEFGKGKKGLQAIAYLEQKLHCTIAASNDLTGVDGDWDLEVGVAVEPIKLEGFEGNLQCTGIVGGTADTDDFDGDGICNGDDLDDDNDGILDYEESIYTCSGEQFDFSGINTNTPVVGNVFSGRLLTQANTAYPDVTFDFDVTEVVGTKSSSWGEIRGNSNGDIAFARNRDGVIEGKLTFSEPITFSINEDFSLGGSTGGADSWDFSVASGAIFYEDPGTSDFNVLSYAMDSISLELLGGDNDWNLKFIDVSEITLRFTSTGVDNTSVLSFEVCSTQDLDTDLDTVVNRFDLDSDDDGCYDAIEGGGSFTSSDLTLNNNLCNTSSCVDSNGVPTNSGVPQSVGTSQNDTVLDADCPCKEPSCDFDGDGILNEDDIDDDNDGIIDTEEGCINTEFGGDDTTITGTGTPSYIRIMYSFVADASDDNNANASQIITVSSITDIVANNLSATVNSGFEISGGTSSTLAEAKTNNEYLEFSFTTLATLKEAHIDWIGFYNNTNTNPAFSLTYSISSDGGTNFTDLATFVENAGDGGGVFPAGIENEDITSYSLDPSTTYKIRIYLYNFIGETFYLDDVYLAFDACKLDTDGDGVLNHFDLDSDGDGCPDAKEASVSGTLISGNIENGDGTTNTITNVSEAIAEGSYGVNGLADAIETNDTFSATTTYTSTYTSTALNSSVSVCVCYKVPAGGSAVLSSVGISTLNRALTKSATDWPLNKNSAYLVLDSHEKGLVITRLTTTQVNALNAVEGMLVYDVNEDCLKLFDGSNWFCLKQTCIDN